MEKPQPNYKRDGIFIVSLILIVMILEVATGTDDSLSLIHISEPTRRRGISYAVFCLKKKKAANSTR